MLQQSLLQSLSLELMDLSCTKSLEYPLSLDSANIYGLHEDLPPERKPVKLMPDAVLSSNLV